MALRLLHQPLPEKVLDHNPTPPEPSDTRKVSIVREKVSANRMDRQVEPR